jgi:hypothetical protein
MKPSIGRIVHYQTRTQDMPSMDTPGRENGHTLAAIITRVWDNGSDVALTIFNPWPGIAGGDSFPHAPDDKPTPGHWNWPPRVD